MEKTPDISNGRSYDPSLRILRFIAEGHSAIASGLHFEEWPPRYTTFLHGKPRNNPPREGSARETVRSVHFVSCKQTISGCALSSQASNRSCRLRNELMFHVTIFIPKL